MSRVQEAYREFAGRLGSKMLGPLEPEEAFEAGYAAALEDAAAEIEKEYQEARYDQQGPLARAKRAVRKLGEE